MYVFPVIDIVGIISHIFLCRVVASGYPECGVTISQVIIKTLRKRDVITDYAPLLTHFIAHYDEKCPETSHDDDVCTALLCDYEYE